MVIPAIVSSKEAGFVSTTEKRFIPHFNHAIFSISEPDLTWITLTVTIYQ